MKPNARSNSRGSFLRWVKSTLRLMERRKTVQSSFRKGILIAGALLVSSLGISAQKDLNNPTGRSGLLLIDKRGNHVRFFDPATFKELSNFSTGAKAPHVFAISAAHRTAY